MRVWLCVVGAFSVVGCATARVRGEAASTLSCPETQVSLKEERQGVWVATGCGRAAICTIPPEEGADIQCGGGGEIHPSMQ